MEGDDSDNLPVPRDEERIEKLRDIAETLDEGESREEMIPVKAYDTGDTDERDNPRANDLDYVEGAEMSVARNFAGRSIMYDEENGDAKIECDPELFISDVREMN